MKQYKKSWDYKIYNDENLPDSGYETVAIVFSAISYIMSIGAATIIASYVVSHGANLVVVAILFLTGVSLLSLLVAITNNIRACARLRKLRQITRAKENQDKSPA